MLTIHPWNCSEGMAKAQKVYTVANLPRISSTDTKLKLLYCTA